MRKPMLQSAETSHDGVVFAARVTQLVAVFVELIRSSSSGVGAVM